MGILDRFFQSDSTKIVEAEQNLRGLWTHYVATVPEKHALINGLTITSLPTSLSRLFELLTLELLDIEKETVSEGELLGRLKNVEHEKVVLSLQRVERALGYAETKYQYFHELLRRLHDCLQMQLHIAEKLAFRPGPQLIAPLKGQVVIEGEIIKRIDACKTFEDGFVQLMTKVQVIEQLDKRQGRLLKGLNTKLGRVFSNQQKSGVLFEWAIAVMKGLEEAVFDAIGDQLLGQHEHVEFEFVNKPVFVELVRRCIPARERKVEEETIVAFVAAFREWFNARAN